MTFYISQAAAIERMLIISALILAFGVVSIGGLWLLRRRMKAPVNELPTESYMREISAAKDDSSRATTKAMANLAEAIQAMVGHMRSEQQMIRDWVETQSEQQREIRKLLERLAREEVIRGADARGAPVRG